MLTFQLNFVSEIFLMDLEPREYLCFSVDYSTIDKSDILNIHKYLMRKNNTT